MKNRYSHFTPILSDKVMIALAVIGIMGATATATATLRRESSQAPPSSHAVESRELQMGLCVPRSDRCRRGAGAAPSLFLHRSLGSPDVVSFRLRGSLVTPPKVRTQPDQAPTRIHITLKDASGSSLLDRTIERNTPKWQVDAKKGTWTYSSPDARSSIQRVALARRQHSGKKSFDLDVQGLIPAAAIADFHTLQTAALVRVAWGEDSEDSYGSCSEIKFSNCSVRETRNGTYTFCPGK